MLPAERNSSSEGPSPDVEKHRVELHLKQVASSVQALEQSVSQTRRRSRLESIWVYLLFLGVVLAAAYAIVQLNSAAAAARYDMLQSKFEALEQANHQLVVEIEAWKNIETSLMEFDDLIRNGQKELAVERFAQLKHLRFAGLLLQLVDRFKAEVARQKFDLGVEHFEKGSFRRADDAFELALRYEGSPPYLGALLYYRGMSAIRLRKFNQAALLLEQALKEGLNKKQRVQARFHRAYAYDRSGRRRLARQHYSVFQRQHPKSHLAQQAKVRYKALEGQ